MFELLTDKDLEWKDKWEILLGTFGFPIYRITCWFLGCDIKYWSENEYISGEYCERCDASESNIEGKTPHKIITENLWERILGKFGIYN